MVDAERFLTSSARVAAVPKHLIVKWKVGDFAFPIERTISDCTEHQKCSRLITRGDSK